MVEGFAELQENGIVQRDVKPQNIIMVENLQDLDHFYYKISDFGIACQLENETKVIPEGRISFTQAYVTLSLQMCIRWEF